MAPRAASVRPSRRAPQLADRCPLAMAPYPVFHGERYPVRRVVKDVDVVLVGRPTEREALSGLLAFGGVTENRKNRTGERML